MNGSHEILVGDVREQLQTLPENLFHCCVTSPPYWALRDYKVDGQIGSEGAIAEFLEVMVDVFRGVKRVLRPDGVLWLNIGDTYSTGKANVPFGNLCNIPHQVAAALQADGWVWRSTVVWRKPSPVPESLSGWRWVRCRVKVGCRYNAENPHPSSVDGVVHSRSVESFGRAQWSLCPGCPKCESNGGYVLRKGSWRCTTGHEYLFMLTKSDRYFCDGNAVAEAAVGGAPGNKTHKGAEALAIGDAHMRTKAGLVHMGASTTRNPRSVWSIPSEAYRGAHFATFPTNLILKPILSSTSSHGCCSACGSPHAPIVETERCATRPGVSSKIDDTGMSNRDAARHCTDTKILGYRPTCNCNADTVPCRVLDPFAGSGTTLQVATWLGRDAVGIELNPDYVTMAEERIARPPKCLEKRIIKRNDLPLGQMRFRFNDEAMM